MAIMTNPACPPIPSSPWTLFFLRLLSKSLVNHSRSLHVDEVLVPPDDHYSRAPSCIPSVLMSRDRTLVSIFVQRALECLCVVRVRDATLYHLLKVFVSEKSGNKAKKRRKIKKL